MKPFWTITDVDTNHTNSRSEKFSKEILAIDAATYRVRCGASKAVVILKAVKLVTHNYPPPVKVEDIESVVVEEAIDGRTPPPPPRHCGGMPA